MDSSASVHQITNPTNPNNGSSDLGSYSVNSKIMIVAIVVLFGVVMFILGLHLYAKWFWRNGGGLLRSGSARRSWRRRRRLEFAVNTAGQARRIGQVGLDDAEVERLPTFVFNPEKASAGAIECAVCLEEFVDGEQGRLLPKCNHSFHIDCIDMWFESHSTCPLCRCNVVPDPPLAAETCPFDPTVLLREAPQSISPSDSSIRIPGFDIPETGGMAPDDTLGVQAVTPFTETPEVSARSNAVMDLASTQRRPSSAGFSPKPSAVVQYPANVLFWGTKSQTNVGLNGEEISTGRVHAQSCLVIEIPRALVSSIPVAGDEPSRLSDAGGSKSPIGRLVSTSFRRLLSIRRGGATSPGPTEGNSSCGTNDSEQGASILTCGPAQRQS